MKCAMMTYPLDNFATWMDLLKVASSLCCQLVQLNFDIWMSDGQQLHIPTTKETQWTVWATYNIGYIIYPCADHSVSWNQAWFSGYISTVFAGHILYLFFFYCLLLSADTW